MAVSWQPPGGSIDVGVMDLSGGTARWHRHGAPEFDPAWVRPDGNSSSIPLDHAPSVFSATVRLSGTNTLRCRNPVAPIRFLTRLPMGSS